MALSELAHAVLAGDALVARQWVLDHRHFEWSNVGQPSDLGPRELAIAAALVELFCDRAGAPRPAWTATVAAADDEPLFLMRSAATLPRLRKRIELETPEPLRRRRLFAPADFLTAA